MESKDLKPKKNQVKTDDLKNKPVQQMRPDDSHESIMTPPSDEEVKASVSEMNPDGNSMNSRG